MLSSVEPSITERKTSNTWLTVIENFKFGLKLKKLPKSEQDDIAAEFLKLIKLEEFKDYNVYQLSGGMQQRVTLARALAIESPYVLMDEPFSSLDKQTINILREELELLWRQLKNTIIYVTHSVEEAIFFADRIVMLSANPGRIKKIFDVKLPRPRKVDDEEVVHLRSMILKELRYEVELSEKKDCRVASGSAARRSGCRVLIGVRRERRVRGCRSPDG
jgi:NitT/TauT family transport system ATP-binding protein